jgi:hypothetical protein
MHFLSSHSLSCITLQNHMLKILPISKVVLGTQLGRPKYGTKCKALAESGSLTQLGLAPRAALPTAVQDLTTNATTTITRIEHLTALDSSHTSMLQLRSYRLQ